MVIRSVDPEILGLENFRPTEHRNIFTNLEAGKIVILQENDKALLVVAD